MKFAEAIAALQASELENREAIVTAITSRLKEQNDYEKTNKQLESQLTTLLEVSGAEGEDFNSRLSSAKSNVEKLAGELKTAQEQLVAANEENKRRERDLAIQSFAESAKANAKVLKRLLTESDEVKVVGDIPMVGAKTLKDWASAEYPEFVPVLFQAEQQPTDGGKQPLLPSGGSQPPKREEPKKHVDRLYPVPSHLKQGV